MYDPKNTMAGKAARASDKKMGKLCDMADDLALVEQLKAEILPGLKEDLRKGLSAEEILEKYKPYAAARMISNMTTDPDASKSSAAAKDVLDRTIGKAKERTEVVHKYENLTDSELDALVASRTSKK